MTAAPVSNREPASETQAGRRRTARNYYPLARATITVVILGYLFLRLDLGEVLRQLSRVSIGWLSLATALIGLTFLLAGVRWWLLLRVQDISLPLSISVLVTLIGQFFNSFLLGTTGGDLARIYYVFRYSPHKRSAAVLSILVDRAIGLAVLVGLALAGLLIEMHERGDFAESRTIVLALSAMFISLLLGGTLMALLPFHRLPAALKRLLRKIPHIAIAEKMVVAFRQYRHAPALTFGAVLCSLAIFLLVFAAGDFLARAMGMRVGFFQIAVILAVVVCVISLPISIGGHGVREGMFVVMFAAFGLTSPRAPGISGQELALVYSLLFFSTFLVWSLVGGLFYLTYRRSAIAGSEQAPRRSRRGSGTHG